ncbi:hypothetical protein D3C71_1079140 [compost metagenome]
MGEILEIGDIFIVYINPAKISTDPDRPSFILKYWPNRVVTQTIGIVIIGLYK